jgi:protein-disulfide isomerase
MADKSEQPEVNTSSSKKSDSRMLIFAVLGFVVLAGLYYVANAPKPVIEEPASEVAEANNEDAASSVVLSGIDINKAKTERVLGDPAAPIKISEHASLTCSHCAAFHKETFEAFKKNYIDTGKAYLVYSDFPLNAPALQATLLSRCIPEERYFDFIHDLFINQSQWAYDSAYLEILKGKAIEHGLAADKFEVCMKNEELQNALLDRMKAVQKQWNINSTPSFVVNNQIVISGEMTYEEFDKKIQEAVQKMNEPSVPEAAPDGSEAPQTETTKEGE